MGLGNVSVTPDSLGPYVLDNVVVTRHLFKIDSVNEGYSEVSGFSPGVMGNTGIETFDIIKSVVDKIDVDFVIVVDALAAASIARVNRTIQVTDTGISPGSGVGNSRKEISYDTLKKPVIAIGVPTVVDAVTIVSDTMDFMAKYLNQKITNSTPLANNLTLKSVALDYDKVKEPSKDSKEHLLGQIGLLNNKEKRVLLEEVLSSNGYNMMVTPKEVDADIEDLAKIIILSIILIFTIINNILISFDDLVLLTGEFTSSILVKRINPKVETSISYFWLIFNYLFFFIFFRKIL